MSDLNNPVSRSDIVGLTADIVASYVSRNTVPANDLPGVIATVFRAFSSLGQDAVVEAKPIPVVSPKRSVFPDYIVCLEDGKKLKTLKRHLRTSYDMTPEEYRAKWGLPADYPMTAPNYAERRSQLAKQIGLGRKAA